MAKIHIAISKEPIKLGKTVRAFCLDDIPNAQAVMIDDLSETPSTVILCRKCWGAPEAVELEITKDAAVGLAEKSKKLYVAAIVSGEDALHP